MLSRTRQYSADLIDRHQHLKPGPMRLLRHKTALLLDGLFFDLAELLGTAEFLECGAHEASSSVRYLKRTGGHAIAIEANPYVFSRKTRKAARHGVRAINAALCERAGIVEFNIPAHNRMAVTASLRKRNTSLRKRNRKRYNTVTVPGLSLNDLVNGQECALWIDVEGASLEVLKGADRVLPKCRLLKVELEDKQLWNGQAIASDVDSLLEQAGFVPVFCDAEYAHQFNAIYIPSYCVEHCTETVSAYETRMNDLHLTAWEKLFPVVRKMDHHVLP